MVERVSNQRILPDRDWAKTWKEEPAEPYLEQMKRYEQNYYYRPLKTPHFH